MTIHSFIMVELKAHDEIPFDVAPDVRLYYWPPTIPTTHHYFSDDD
jgi:hypothetical protein